MKRKIESAFHFLDYRFLLNEDFLSRTAANNSYSLRAYSRDLEVSPGFLSEVLRGQKELSVQSGKKLFSKLGFEDDEINYIENLITYKIASDEFERENAGEFIRKHHKYLHLQDRPDKDGYIKSIDHFLVYGFTRRINNLSEIEEYAELVGIKPIRVLEVLNDMIREGYIEKKGSQYFVTELDLTIRFDERVLQMIREFTNLATRTIKAQGGLQIPDRVVQGLVLGLDKESYEMALTAHRHFVQHMHRLAAGSKEIEHFVLVTNTFLTLTPAESPSKKDN